MQGTEIQNIFGFFLSANPRALVLALASTKSYPVSRVRRRHTKPAERQHLVSLLQGWQHISHTCSGVSSTSLLDAPSVPLLSASVFVDLEFLLAALVASLSPEEPLLLALLSESEDWPLILSQPQHIWKKLSHALSQRHKDE